MAKKNTNLGFDPEDEENKKNSSENNEEKTTSGKKRKRSNKKTDGEESSKKSSRKKKMQQDYEPSEETKKAMEDAAARGEDMSSPLYKVPKRVSVTDPDKLGIEISSLNEMRVLIRTFYKLYQPNRIMVENQKRSLTQGYSEGEIDDLSDSVIPGSTEDDLMKFPAYAAIIDQQREAEASLKKLIEKYVQTSRIGQYLSSITGIGPLIAGSLISYIAIERIRYAGQVHSYAGLNDNNDPWLSDNDVSYIMSEIVGNRPIDENVIAEISAWSGRDPKRIKTGATVYTDDGIPTITKASLKAYLKKPPFNREFKKLCWKLGESILKLKNNPKSVYGRLLTERIIYEKTKNLEYGYIQEAMKQLGWIRKTDLDLPKQKEFAMLKEMQDAIENGTFKPKYSKDTISYQSYVKGMIPDGHILARCKRWVVKLIISHVFEAMYIDFYGMVPPAPYVMSNMGHHEYIEPEVPYQDFWPEVENIDKIAILARTAAERANAYKAGLK